MSMCNAFIISKYKAGKMIAKKDRKNEQYCSVSCRKEKKLIQTYVYNLDHTLKFNMH